MALNRTLLQNGCVITVDKELGNFRRADVLIEGTKIAAIGPDLGAADAEVIDASNMIVMPGFIDTHRHLWEGILRNIGVDYPLEGEVSYLAFVLNVLAPVYRPEDVYAGNRNLALLTMLWLTGNLPATAMPTSRSMLVSAPLASMANWRR